MLCAPVSEGDVEEQERRMKLEASALQHWEPGLTWGFSGSWKMFVET